MDCTEILYWSVGAPVMKFCTSQERHPYTIWSHLKPLTSLTTFWTLTSHLMILHAACVEAGPALLQQFSILLLRHFAASDFLLDLHLDDLGDLRSEDLKGQEDWVEHRWWGGAARSAVNLNMALDWGLLWNDGLKSNQNAQFLYSISSNQRASQSAHYLFCIFVTHNTMSTDLR